jgi:hypothetical protein
MLNKFGHAISSLSVGSPMGLVVGLGHLAITLQDTSILRNSDVLRSTKTQETLIVKTKKCQTMENFLTKNRETKNREMEFCRNREQNSDFLFPVGFLQPSCVGFL